MAHNTAQPFSLAMPFTLFHHSTPFDTPYKARSSFCFSASYLDRGLAWDHRRSTIAYTFTFNNSS